jgi:hypothetical protein
MRPRFTIIGAQESAITFVQRYLQVHSDVFLPAGELAVFEDSDHALLDARAPHTLHLDAMQRLSD